ncbi:hypothetical protein BAUCODRAFT_76484 [Baudoinia panamericana UAMH 10762]|uniref:2-oxoadipate dioxygenase/decarboxylase n=1 Tax=Baudoinia panamericana (strain UAMH 10762) TaxID=717646 RepID=M2MPR4_BAUPA|nr:uncharacterized protein BAUCODRAFT_76484 [Baudoinia panamericana UAMH 10762]EMC93433.1 hypothetical protein BAUCODRAFT_76484 [Baudoinia panamericana UAMH 10762]
MDPIEYNGSCSAVVEQDHLRTIFALALSSMYRKEVPLYGDLVSIVRDINSQVLFRTRLGLGSDSSERLDVERHGAIRLGTPAELQTVRRIFALLGMRAVDYYDLSVAGLPMHATAFRSVDRESLARNPFRVFTTLLRPELLDSDEARMLALKLLERRQIFTEKLLEWLDIADSQGGRLKADQIEHFIPQALLTFSWRPTAAATYAEYEELREEHPILADVACFQSAHINHLTPRVLDIEAAHRAMQAAGMAVKSAIEGPPQRQHPILLRQTSFLALEEPVRFPYNDSIVASDLVSGSHKARFGEIEERGAALTAKGRQLYDELQSAALCAGQSIIEQSRRDAIVAAVFDRFPDDWSALRSQGLLFCEYSCDTTRIKTAMSLEKKSHFTPELLEALITEGVIQARPITYEDFLPFSAAGIFRSNLQSNFKQAAIQSLARYDRSGLECALGCKVLSSETLYAGIEEESLERCAVALGLVR